MSQWRETKARRTEKQTITVEAVHKSRSSNTVLLYFETAMTNWVKSDPYRNIIDKEQYNNFKPILKTNIISSDVIFVNQCFLDKTVYCTVDNS